MSSLVSGYEYDIFISYRHNDNLDGWVSDFVQNLEKELRSTLKDTLTIYFDKNPHDGLLETHNVDKSLEGKLKCLIFIPIISQTYCDPNCFAWRNEFLAFNKFAKEDQFGVDIRLANGNFASRVVPVKIHDLEAEDKTLLENELGSVLRSIEFIFNSPGVNRPLLPMDEARSSHSGKIFYRDQINKVANAVKEIISALKDEELRLTGKLPHKKVKNPSRLSQPLNKIHFRKSIAISSGLVMFVLLTSYLIFTFTTIRTWFFTNSSDKSIAVLPFKNISMDKDSEYFSDGMTEETINYLAKIADLKVMSRTSIEQYKNQNKDIRIIAKELGVSNVLEGSVRKSENKFRITVQLIQAETGYHLWSEEFDRELTDIFAVQSEIAQRVSSVLRAILSENEKKSIRQFDAVGIEAYDFYLRARSEWRLFNQGEGDDHFKRAISMYRNALQSDSSFARAYVGLAEAYYNDKYMATYLKEDFLDSMKILTDKAINLDVDTEEAYYFRAIYYYERGEVDLALADLNYALKINPNYADAMLQLAEGLLGSKQDYSSGLKLMERALRLEHGPDFGSRLIQVGGAYEQLGFFNRSEQLYLAAARLDGDSSAFYRQKSYLNHVAGHYEKAIQDINNAFRHDSSWFNVDRLHWELVSMGKYDEALKVLLNYIKSKGSLPSTFFNMHRLGFLYWKLGDKNKAMQYLNRFIFLGEESIRLKRGLATNYYAYYDLAGLYSFLDEKKKAHAYLEKFREQNFFPFWWISLIKEDPFFNNFRNETQFKAIVREMEVKYKKERELVRRMLEKEDIKFNY